MARWFLPGALVLASACAPGAAQPAPIMTPAPSRPDGVLTVGSVSMTVGREHEVVEPFADYLAARLARFNIGRARVVVVDSLHTMVEEINSDRVDIYIDSPFPVAFVASRGAKVRVLLRRWKRGSDEYRSVMFTRNDSGIDALDGLRGQMIAFGEPFSTTGFLLPKATLAAAGFELVHFQDPAATVAPGNVGYVFSNDSENTMFWVLKGKVAAGAVNEEYYAMLAGTRADELKVLRRTQTLPRNIVCARANLDPELVSAIVEVLLAMKDDDEGRSVLQAFEDTTRFDRFPQGDEQALAEVVDMLPFVESDLGK
jgi:phosphonate transport system substrate-binding protein